MRCCSKCGSSMVIAKNVHGKRSYECWVCNKVYAETWLRKFARKIFNI